MKKMMGLALLTLLLSAAGAYPEQSVRVEGIIINIGDTSIEIKRGKTEITLHWLENSKIVMNGTEVGKDEVRICQKARAVYNHVDGRNDLVTLELLRESYCTR